MEFTMKAVGRVQGGRNEAIDDNWGASRARIALDPAQFDATALAGDMGVPDMDLAGLTEARQL